MCKIVEDYARERAEKCAFDTVIKSCVLLGKTIEETVSHISDMSLNAGKDYIKERYAFFSKEVSNRGVYGQS